MKILELRFKNLNSLYGEWRIDFTAPEFVSNGIFALTGPTGSGKSTVLDAICLALYGATPRLGKITQTNNEIMSRQTGECYAEVIFQSQPGKFLCHWEQRRARKKTNGALQQPEHQIVDGNTYKPIETRRSLVVGVVEEKTGMDFDRFTRSTLLAQGGFDTFLRAEVEDKSKILEQITGTKIYSDISIRVHERERDERDKLNLLQAETSGIVILDPESEKAIQLELGEKQKEETELAGKSIETGKAIAWLNSVEGLKKEIDSLSVEAEKLRSDAEAFQPERDKFNWAEKAAALAGVYAMLSALRKQQSRDQADLDTEETAFPKLESSAGQLAELLKSAEQQTAKAKAELKTAAPLIRDIRSIDQELASRITAVSNAEKNGQRDADKIDVDKQTQLEEQQKQDKARKKLKLVNAYFLEHAQDEWLVRGLTGVEEQLGSLLSRQKDIAEKEIDFNKAETASKQAGEKLEICTTQCEIYRKKLAETSDLLQQGEGALSELLGTRLLREYRTEKETLLRERAFLSRIAELEDYRIKLEDGKPCPLCGAKEHPFAKGNVPALDETEKKITALDKLIDQAEDMEAANKEQEKTEAAARKVLADQERREITAANEKNTADQTLTESEEGLKKLRAVFAGLKLAVFDKLRPLGITEITDDVSSLLNSLKARQKAWLTQVDKKAGIEKQIADIDSEIKRLEAVIQTQNTALFENREHLKTLKMEYAAENDERKRLYGDKIPDEEENRLNKVVADAEKAEKQSGIQYFEIQRQLTAGKVHVESLKERIKQREPERKKAEADFSSAFAAAGFPDEKQFLASVLTSEQRDALFAKVKDLENRQTDLKARQKDRETRLAVEMAKHLTDNSMEELELQSREYEKSLNELRDAIANLKHRLSMNMAAKEQLKGKQQAIETQKKECNRWERLHNLIGSADGKKYRNFAQGLTFELMVSHANRQLEKMTDRYLLIRDWKEPLELNVIDNYQAGEIRSTKNLSGGESFIVSLSLALGLSKMSSRKVRVDSLFLDEGFGTLDEDALETALETLAGLQQDGKLIGIISHVTALKERIGTQIIITTESGGRSTISGPGCRREKNNG